MTALFALFALFVLIVIFGIAYKISGFLPGAGLTYNTNGRGNRGEGTHPLRRL
jgi:hypothetical protein